MMIDPAAPLDPRSAHALATLRPALQIKAAAFLRAVRESGRIPDGFKIKIISGFRSYAEQAEDYAKGRVINGRATPGPRVTNSPPGYSYHNFGLAFDIGLFDPIDRYYDDLDPRAADRYYGLLGSIGKALGLEWGGDWTNFQDLPHYQLSGGLSLADLRALHEREVTA